MKKRETIHSKIDREETIFGKRMIANYGVTHPFTMAELVVMNHATLSALGGSPTNAQLDQSAKARIRRKITDAMGEKQFSLVLNTLMDGLSNRNSNLFRQIGDALDRISEGGRFTKCFQNPKVPHIKRLLSLVGDDGKLDLTCAEYLDDLARDGFEMDEKDLRKIAKRLGISFKPARKGRPQKGGR